MSAVNPTHIIAEALAQFDTDYFHNWSPAAAHVVSELTDAGFSIIETERYERLQRGANELGRRLGRQLQDVLDLTGAHDLIDEDGDGDWMHVWERLGELVAKGRAMEGADRIKSATTTEEVRAVIGELLPAAAAEGEK